MVKGGGYGPRGGVWYTLPPPVLTSSGSHQSRQYASSWNSFLLPSTTKLQQGNVFTPVCHSVRSWGCLSPQGRHPLADTPLGRPPPLRSAYWDTANKRAVRILLDCILVLICCVSAKSILLRSVIVKRGQGKYLISASFAQVHFGEGTGWSISPSPLKQT